MKLQKVVVKMFLLKICQPRPLLFIFVIFKHNAAEKTVDFSRIQTRIVGVDGMHADHSTNTTTFKNILCFEILIGVMKCFIFLDRASVI